MIKPRTLVVLVVAGATAALFAGTLAPGASGATARGADHVTFGHSVHGTALKAVRLGNPHAKRTALIVGSIHGNEAAGHDIVHVIRHAHHDLRGVDLWVVKTVNPDGVAANTRKNADGVDLNRNFSYRWRGGVSHSSGYYPGPRPFSEPESRAVRRLAKRIQPDVTIWYHQPWGAVLLPCHGPARVQKRYARIARFPTDRCRGSNLRGTATSWENHHFPGRAFVVELPAGELSNRDAHRHARAAVKVAKSGAGHGQRRAKADHQVAQPPIQSDPIPYGHDRKHEMAGYSARHYGKREWRLRDPHVIVLHFTATSSYQPVWNTFASDAPNMGELPGTCAHFVIAQSGRIHKLVKTSIRCRHAIGLNYTAIGIEMVQPAGRGSHWADNQILHRKPQIHRALRLVAFLKQRFGIKMRDIIGHAMANDIPYFKDLEGWRNDHTDWLRGDVRKFRERLERMLRH